MSRVLYKGISGAVRREVNSGGLSGEITIAAVRELLPDGKNRAPESVIRNSLNYLTQMNEIERRGARFFTKSVPVQVLTKKVIVTGNLMDTKVKDGKCVVTIEVDEMEECASA